MIYGTLAARADATIQRHSNIERKYDPVNMILSTFRKLTNSHSIKFHHKKTYRNDNKKNII
jgi:hypothetical protein